MLNDDLSFLGVPQEWRPPLYHKRPRPRHDSDLYLETDPALKELLADDQSPKLDVWRGVLRIWRELKDIRISDKQARLEYENGTRKRRPKLKRPTYAFEIDGRRYQSHVNEDLDLEIRRHLGVGVTMVDNHVRLGDMSLSHVMLEALAGRTLGTIVEMQGVDAEEYGNCLVEKAYSSGLNTTILKIAGFADHTPILNFYPIEALLEKQDKDRKSKAA